ncbi:MAG: NAD(P)/FAD-dependent oxidoreductase [Clostridia bacterium]|nr:NAD(P)/FAD-dependent oxidoreductase [Clostridia bacterium]
MVDIVIIGAGVIGSFVARSLSKYQLSICVTDRHIDAAMGASGANSGIIHAGYDAIPGTLKAKFNIEGSDMMEKTCEELNVPYKKTGSLVIAFNDEEISKIQEMYDHGTKEGIRDMSLISKEQVLTLEPNLSPEIKGALLAKTAAIVSPYKLNINALENAVRNGVEFLREHTVLGIKKEKEVFSVITDKGTLTCRMVINCAGLYADEIARMVGDDSFKIIPRSGEYILLDKSEGTLVNHVVFQAPTMEGKGVLITSTVDGNLLIGPDAKEIKDKDERDTHRSSIDYVYKKGLQTTDKLLLHKSVTIFTGVRATPDKGDFIIEESRYCKGFINVAGIESPGLSSAPAIGNHVALIVKSIIGDISEKENYSMTLEKKKYFSEMNEEEKKEAILKNPLYGKIICRCESVTEGEIIDSIHQKAGAVTIDGVKRRTRAGMGRCQGGFCLPHVMDILSRELKVDKDKIQKGDEGSYILTGRTRQ